MDLSSITASTTPFEVRHPVTAEPIGLVVNLKPLSHPDVKAVQRRLLNENIKRHGKGLSAEKIEANRIDTMIAAIDSWQWTGDATFGGERPECTPDNIRKVLKADWIRSQFDEFLGEEAAFFQNAKAS